MENESWEQLRRLLQATDETEVLVNSANAVVMTHSEPTLQVDDPFTMANNTMNAMKKLTRDCQWQNKKMVLPSSSRRAQKPTPQPDADCQQALELALAARKQRVDQVNSLLVQAVAANCANPSRRLKRMMGYRNQLRTLQVSHKCDTAEKAVKLALGYLTASSHWW